MDMLTNESFLDFIKKSFIVFETDNQGIITYANEKFKDVYGYDEIVGQNVNIINSNYHSDFFYFKLWQLIKQGKSWNDVVRNKQKNGNIVWEEKTVIKINDNRFLSVGVDKTKEFDLSEDLAIAGKLSIIGEMTSSIIHEVMNRMTVFSAGLHNIKKGIKNFDFETVEKGQAICDENYYKMLEIFNSMRKILENDNLVIEKMNLNVKAICDDVFRLLAPTLNKHTIVYKTDGNSLFLNVINTQIQQVFLNLIKNSYMAIMNNKGEKWITVNFTETETDVIITVTDSGMGIPKEHQEKIFKNLFTTKDEGTGLGLAFCKKTVEENYNGTIYLNKECENTQFVIKIQKYEQY